MGKVKVKKTASISSRLQLACCSLLGASQAQAESEPWLVELGVMNFIEQDRNTGLEFLVSGKRELDDGGEVDLSVVVDVITGATPNGATASNAPQTFSMASGVGSYSVGANELPADDTHMDTRLSLKAGWLNPLNENQSVKYQGLISMEFDYLSFAGGLSYQLETNNNNTQWSAGINAEYNRVHPVGNIPVALATLPAVGQTLPRGVSSEGKSLLDLSWGVTQVLDVSSVLQLQLGVAKYEGYLNDPYKILSIIDDQNNASLGATQAYIYENRPDDRNIKKWSAAYKQSISGDVLDSSYQYYDDDWGVKSYTIELGYRFNRKAGHFVRPSFRLYQQQAASFYFHSLPSSMSIPQFATADSRLAEFDAITLGVEWGRENLEGEGHTFSIQYYHQKGDSYPGDAIGIQRQQDLFPELKTIIFQYVTSYEW